MSDDNPQARRISDTDERILDKILGFERSTHDILSILNNKISVMESEHRHLLKHIDQLVSRLEFTPIKLLVYGMTSIILGSVVAALIALVMKK